MAQLQAGTVSPAGQATVADSAEFASGGVTLLIAEVDTVLCANEDAFRRSS